MRPRKSRTRAWGHRCTTPRSAFPRPCESSPNRAAPAATSNTTSIPNFTFTSLLRRHERPAMEAYVGSLIDPAIRDILWLRNVERDDLPRMYQMQLDPEANRLAVT